MATSADEGIMLREIKRIQQLREKYRLDDTDQRTLPLSIHYCNRKGILNTYPCQGCVLLARAPVESVQIPSEIVRRGLEVQYLQDMGKTVSSKQPCKTK